MTAFPPPDPIPGKLAGSSLRHMTVLSLAGLAAGMVGGLLLLATRPSWAGLVLGPAQALVQGWTNAFRIVVVPLVLAQLYVAVVGRHSSSREVGRLGLITPVVFIGLLAFTATLSVLVANQGITIPWLEGLSLPTPGNDSVADQSQIAVPSTAWVDSFLPPNLTGANVLLPLMIFMVGFGLAARRLDQTLREPLLGIFEAGRRALFVMVGWLLLAVPVVLLALGLTTTAQAGVRVGGALLGFTLLEFVALFAAILALYGLTVVLGGVSLRWLVRALWPAQLIAITTRSSLATIPALLKSAEASTGPAQRYASYVLPLAGALLKLSRAVSSPVRLIFLAHLLGIPLTLERVVIFATTIILISPSTVGVPSVTSGTRSLPAYVAAGIPAEYVVLLGAATSITDMVLTFLNTTSYMSANVLVGRFASGKEKAAEPASSPVVRPLEGPGARATSGGGATA